MSVSSRSLRCHFFVLLSVELLDANVLSLIRCCLSAFRCHFFVFLSLMRCLFAAL